MYCIMPCFEGKFFFFKGEQKLMNVLLVTLIFFCLEQNSKRGSCICGVMATMLASSAVYREFEPLSGQTKDYKIGSCNFSAKHAALRRKSKDWLAWNQDNVSE